MYIQYFCSANRVLVIYLWLLNFIRKSVALLQLQDIGMNLAIRPNLILWWRLSSRSYASTNPSIDLNSSYSVDEKSEDSIPTCTRDANTEKQLSDGIRDNCEHFELNSEWKKWSKGGFGTHPGKCRLAPIEIPENFSNSSAAYLRGVLS